MHAGNHPSGPQSTSPKEALGIREFLTIKAARRQARRAPQDARLDSVDYVKLCGIVWSEFLQLSSWSTSVDLHQFNLQDYLLYSHTFTPGVPQISSSTCDPACEVGQNRTIDVLKKEADSVLCACHGTHSCLCGFRGLIR